MIYSKAVTPVSALIFDYTHKSGGAILCIPTYLSGEEEIFEQKVRETSLFVVFVYDRPKSVCRKE